jgi:hypothetical protein
VAPIVTDGRVAHPRRPPDHEFITDHQRQRQFPRRKCPYVGFEVDRVRGFRRALRSIDVQHRARLDVGGLPGLAPHTFRVERHDVQ